MTAPRIFEPYGHAERKKTQKFAYSSALRPNQILFSHGQGPSATLAAHRGNGFDVDFSFY
jgi:hypothetical protein